MNVQYILRLSLFALLLVFTGLGLCSANFAGDRNLAEASSTLIYESDISENEYVKIDVGADHSSVPHFSTIKKAFKKKIKIRGYGASFIPLPTPVYYSEKLVPKPLIGGMAAYTQPYFLSSQYSFLFRLTPF